MHEQNDFVGGTGNVVRFTSQLYVSLVKSVLNLSHFKGGCKLFSFFEKIFECKMVII